MPLTLYHYVHCPFCIRVRLVLGFLNLNYESVVVSYDDEEAPKNLTGKKMLPILACDTGVMNESLEIISFLDSSNKLKYQQLNGTEDFIKATELLNLIGESIHSLAMPYWIWTPEFSESSRNYFRKIKENKRGPFSNLVKNQSFFLNQLDPSLKDIEKALSPFYNSPELSLYDIIIASHLWGLYMVPEFQFSEKIHHYLQTVKHICHFNYHKDFWG